MEDLAHLAERRTSTDAVYQYLYDEIVAVRMLPGAKISEADIASQFGISRQPVRDAFNRLGNDGLLQIRPQRATEVRRFSRRLISRARFVRAAVEVEVLRRAARTWDGSVEAEIVENLAAQMDALAKLDTGAFHRLDYKFHHLLCRSADAEFAFDAISENKMQVDRLCVLGLMNKKSMQDLISDHHEILRCLQAQDADGVEAAIRQHLARLDVTIDAVKTSHAEYFEA